MKVKLFIGHTRSGTESLESEINEWMKELGMARTKILHVAQSQEEYFFIISIWYSRF